MKFNAVSSKKTIAKVLVSFILITGTAHCINDIVFSEEANPTYHQAPITNSFDEDVNPISFSTESELELFKKIKRRFDAFKTNQEKSKKLTYQRNIINHNYQKKS